MSERAVKDRDKRLKRERLLKAAGALIKRAPIEAVSMNQIAQRAGVAKGTLYLYFQTKEEIFLEIHRQDYAAWFAGFTDHLRTLDPAAAPDELVTWMMESLRSNDRFLRLLAISTSMLEKNVGFECAREYKLSIRECALAVGPEIMRVFEVSEPESFAALAHMHALLIGFWHNAVPAEIVRRVYKSDPETFAMLDFDYFDLVENSLALLFRGLRASE